MLAVDSTCSDKWGYHCQTLVTRSPQLLPPSGLPLTMPLAPVGSFQAHVAHSNSPLSSPSRRGVIGAETKLGTYSKAEVN